MRVRHSTLKAKAHDPTPIELERQVRTFFRAGANMRIGESIHPMEIFDISRRGFGARATAPVIIGTRIEVELPHLGYVPAVVRWALCGRFGGMFVRRIEHEDAELIFPHGTIDALEMETKVRAGFAA